MGLKGGGRGVGIMEESKDGVNIEDKRGFIFFSCFLCDGGEGPEKGECCNIFGGCCRERLILTKIENKQGIRWEITEGVCKTRKFQLFAKLEKWFLLSSAHLFRRFIFAGSRALVSTLSVAVTRFLPSSNSHSLKAPHST